MKLTVVSAAYNVLSSIGLERMRESIRSVEAIPIEHEHLIYDGASTDGTVEALRKLESEISSLKLVSERDSGIYDALNKGFLAAKGEYVYVLGLDDKIIDPQRMARVVEDAVANEVDLSISTMNVSPIGVLNPKTARGFYRECLGISYGHQGVLVRRSSVLKCDEMPFDCSYRIAADYRQLLQLHWDGAKVIINTDPFAEFKVGGTSSDYMVVWSEVRRVISSVYELTGKEKERYLRTGSLPWRVFKRYFASDSTFSRRMAWVIALNNIWRKHKCEEKSTYYLLNVPIFKHRSKKFQKRMLDK